MRAPSSAQPTRTSLPGHPIILTRHRPLFEQVQLHLAANGLRIARGTIVDAVVAKAEIINAPSSTKNSDKARDQH
jgi:hypothetical protein